MAVSSVVSPADFAAFSEATGVEYPDNPADKAKLMPAVLQWKEQRQQQQAEGRGPNPLAVAMGVGGLALAGIGGAAVYNQLRRQGVSHESAAKVAAAHEAAAPTAQSRAAAAASAAPRTTAAATAAQAPAGPPPPVIDEPALANNRTEAEQEFTRGPNPVAVQRRAASDGGRTLRQIGVLAGAIDRGTIQARSRGEYENKSLWKDPVLGPQMAAATTPELRNRLLTRIEAESPEMLEPVTDAILSRYTSGVMVPDEFVTEKDLRDRPLARIPEGTVLQVVTKGDDGKITGYGDALVKIGKELQSGTARGVRQRMAPDGSRAYPGITADDLADGEVITGRHAGKGMSRPGFLPPEEGNNALITTRLGKDGMPLNPLTEAADQWERPVGWRAGLVEGDPKALVLVEEVGDGVRPVRFGRPGVRSLLKIGRPGMRRLLKQPIAASDLADPVEYGFPAADDSREESIRAVLDPSDPVYSKLSPLVAEDVTPPASRATRHQEFHGYDSVSWAPSNARKRLIGNSTAYEGLVVAEPLLLKKEGQEEPEIFWVQRSATPQDLMVQYERKTAEPARYYGKTAAEAYAAMPSQPDEYVHAQLQGRLLGAADSYNRILGGVTTQNQAVRGAVDAVGWPVYELGSAFIASPGNLAVTARDAAEAAAAGSLSREALARIAEVYQVPPIEIEQAAARLRGEADLSQPSGYEAPQARPVGGRTNRDWMTQVLSAAQSTPRLATEKVEELLLSPDPVFETRALPGGKAVQVQLSPEERSAKAALSWLNANPGIAEVLSANVSNFGSMPAVDRLTLVQEALNDAAADYPRALAWAQQANPDLAAAATAPGGPTFDAFSKSYVRRHVLGNALELSRDGINPPLFTVPTAVSELIAQKAIRTGRGVDQVLGDLVRGSGSPAEAAWKLDGLISNASSENLGESYTAGSKLAEGFWDAATPETATRVGLLKQRLGDRTALGVGANAQVAARMPIDIQFGSNLGEMEKGLINQDDGFVDERIVETIYGQPTSTFDPSLRDPSLSRAARENSALALAVGERNSSFPLNKRLENMAAVLVNQRRDINDALKRGEISREQAAARDQEIQGRLDRVAGYQRRIDAGRATGERMLSQANRWVRTDDGGATQAFSDALYTEGQRLGAQLQDVEQQLERGQISFGEATRRFGEIDRLLQPYRQELDALAAAPRRGTQGGVARRFSLDLDPISGAVEVRASAPQPMRRLDLIPESTIEEGDAPQDFLDELRRDAALDVPDAQVAGVEIADDRGSSLDATLRDYGHGTSKAKVNFKSLGPGQDTYGDGDPEYTRARQALARAGYGANYGSGGGTSLATPELALRVARAHLDRQQQASPTVVNTLPARGVGSAVDSNLIERARAGHLADYMDRVWGGGMREQDGRLVPQTAGQNAPDPYVAPSDALLAARARVLADNTRPAIYTTRRGV